MREELLYHLMRSQRIGFCDRFEIERVEEGIKPAVDLFVDETGR